MSPNKSRQRYNVMRQSYQNAKRCCQADTNTSSFRTLLNKANDYTLFFRLIRLDTCKLLSPITKNGQDLWRSGLSLILGIEECTSSRSEKEGIVRSRPVVLHDFFS
jgi:hypothetical protein